MHTRRRGKGGRVWMRGVREGKRQASMQSRHLHTNNPWLQALS